MTDKKPWWWPDEINDEWFARIRKDYPDDTADMSKDEIEEKYGGGWKYSDTWDHLGDARGDWQQLADAFLKLVEETGKKPSDFI